MKARRISAPARSAAHRIAVTLAIAGLAATSGPSAGQNIVDAGLMGAVETARAYEHGEGVDKDLLKAAGLYCSAARDGSAEAQFSLGWMYANGRGVPRDDAIAAGLLSMSAAVGHQQALRTLEFVRSDKRALPDCWWQPEVGQQVLDAAPSLPELADNDPFADLPPEKQKIAIAVGKLAPHFAIDLRLALAVVAVESNFEPAARSPKDARGLMQLIPETATRFNVKDRYNVDDNVRGGLAYLRWLLAYYRGQVALAVAAYNAGERAVDRYRGIPPYAETRDYVRRIMQLYPSERHPFDGRIADPSAWVAGSDAGSR